MFKKEIPIIFVGLSITAAALVLGWAVFVKQEVPVQAPVVSDDEIISDDDISNDVENNDSEINVSETPKLTEFFTYAKDDQIFSVSRNEFKVLNEFNALELKSKSEDCGTNKSEQYFKELLFHYLENDDGIEYQFKYQGQTQGSGIWIIIVIPNKIGYTNLEEFKNDFDLCEAGSDRYPYLISESYLFFVSSCGTGHDDGSGLSHGCDIVRGIIEPTIKIK